MRGPAAAPVEPKPARMRERVAPPEVLKAAPPKHPATEAPPAMEHAGPPPKPEKEHGKPKKPDEPPH